AIKRPDKPLEDLSKIPQHRRTHFIQKMNGSAMHYSAIKVNSHQYPVSCSIQHFYSFPFNNLLAFCVHSHEGDMF
ncbi:hypothetical protein M2G54_21180, partial [Vibrio vulnificus]|nr:hypothetical protein [Vibrio vulnificus]